MKSRKIWYGIRVPIILKVSGAPLLALETFFNDKMHATVEHFEGFKASTNPSFWTRRDFVKSQKSGMEYGYPLFEGSVALSLALEKFFDD